MGIPTMSTGKKYNIFLVRHGVAGEICMRKKNGLILRLCLFSLSLTFATFQCHIFGDKIEHNKPPSYDPESKRYRYPNLRHPSLLDPSLTVDGEIQAKNVGRFVKYWLLAQRQHQLLSEPDEDYLESISEKKKPKGLKTKTRKLLSIFTCDGKRGSESVAADDANVTPLSTPQANDLLKQRGAKATESLQLENLNNLKERHENKERNEVNDTNSPVGKRESDGDSEVEIETGEESMKVRVLTYEEKNLPYNTKVDLVITSPLTRCIQTAGLAFKNINREKSSNIPTSSSVTSLSSTEKSEVGSSKSYKPLLFYCAENAREALGVHYPDKRRKTSELQAKFEFSDPQIFFPEDMQECDEDIYWNETSRESIDALQNRINSFFEWLANNLDDLLKMDPFGAGMKPTAKNNSRSDVFMKEESVINVNMNGDAKNDIEDVDMISVQKAEEDKEKEPEIKDEDENTESKKYTMTTENDEMEDENVKNVIIVTHGVWIEQCIDHFTQVNFPPSARDRETEFDSIDENDQNHILGKEGRKERRVYNCDVVHCELITATAPEQRPLFEVKNFEFLTAPPTTATSP